MNRAPASLWLCAVAALAAAACKTEQTYEPALRLTARPATIGDDGQDTDVQVVATDAFARAGQGEVTVTAPLGAFDNGQRSQVLTLDKAGSAFTTWRCDADLDPDCFGPVTLSAAWSYLRADSKAAPMDLTASRSVEVTGCGRIDAGNPPVKRRCAPATASECDGATDTFLASANVPVARRNGAGGNGYDDDCDGLADEGCGCPNSGLTKDCWLVPPTQVEPATGVPPGWCASNSRGSVDCAGAGAPTWTGLCRGAQPAAAHDSCAPGDLNCDGLERNSDLQGCRCAIDLNCPTAPIVLAPFPDPKKLPAIDGTAWLADPAQANATRGWRWTAIGGDCDNVLPFPTFALYRGADSTVAANRVGGRETVVYDTSFTPPRFLVDSSSRLAAIRANTGDGGVGGRIYPAFSLSGDYVVQGEFDVGDLHYACTQKVQVRAPGVRAELCWDSVGPDDVDLHFARLQGTTCDVHGWEDVCSADGGDDCFWLNTRPEWGYPVSPDAACKGWGSRQGGACNNPRLDVDNIRCTRTVADPTNASFCSPENINVDAPNDGDRFAVGVNFYGSFDAGAVARPHVNLYCNGQRLLSTGYNPVTGQVGAPMLRSRGGHADFWTVATVTAHVDGGALVGCEVEPLPSRHADPSRDGMALDGGTDFCVDSPNNLSPAPWTFSARSPAFIEADSGQAGDAGAIPATRADWCKH